MDQQSESLQTGIAALNEAHGKRLKDIAFSSIKSYLSGMKYRPRISDKTLKDRAGVFVTLKKKSELRGCIGFIYPTYEIWDATRKAALHAAFSDPRFKPIRRDELDSLEVEVSVLGQLEKLYPKRNPENINIRLGEDGFMVIGQGSSGLLLPQVATEFGFNAEQFLQATCEKAGLDPDAWKQKGVDVYKFPAKIF